MAQNRDFIRVGKSRIAGSGVFAKRKIPKGTRIIEYIGKRMSFEDFSNDLSKSNTTPTYAFYLNPTTIIDGSRGGNESRFINHSCDPNCETYIFDDNVYVYAKRDILRFEELSFDYQLAPAFDEKDTVLLKDAYICLCGSPVCRGTMLAPQQQ